MSKLNLTGKKFGKLTAGKDVGRTKYQGVLWECLCDCGKGKVVVSSELRSGHVKSCGCLRSDVALGNKSRTGLPHTAESKAKISEKLTGRKFTRTHCENIKKSRTKKFRKRQSKRMSGENNPMFGKKTPDSVKEKLSKSMKGNTHLLGHKHSLETRQQMSIVRKGKQVGSDNPYWKGGKRKQDPYCAIFRDDEFREIIFERDNYQCQNPFCWGNCEDICGHHINYNKQDCIPANVITLCKSCNTRANADRNWHKPFYRALLYRKHGIIYRRVQQ